jgi:hypothetical protein
MNAAGVDRTRQLPFKHMAVTVLAVGILCATASIALKSPTPVEAVGRTLNAIETAIESGRIEPTADPDAALDDAAQAPRSVAPNASLQYLLMHETQRYLVRASEAFQKENYKEAATEMRNASLSMRLEAANATGEARDELHRTMAKLDELATAVQ